MIAVRALSQTDRAAWEPLWAGYLRFYKTDLPVSVSDLTWQRFFDDREMLFALGAFLGDALVGITHYHLHRSTWSASWYCYLEDLYVSEDARGQGAGEALIEAVEREARRTGATRLYWLTHESNAAARRLYDKMALNAGFIRYQKQL